MAYTCDNAQENISAYVDGELGVIDALRLKLHTVRCKKCRETLEFEKDLVSAMSCENFFLPHDFSEKLHKKLEIEYTKSPVKNFVKKSETTHIKQASTPFITAFSDWLNGKRTYLAAGVCLVLFVFGLSVFKFSVNDNTVVQNPDEPVTVYAPKGIARVADTDYITDENIASQEVAGVNQNVFDKFRNKYMTKKFTSNFTVMNDTVAYSTTQSRGITSIMRTIKDVVSDVVSGKKVNTASLPSINVSGTSIAYVRPASASSKVAVDLRDKVAVDVGDESMYGILMVDKKAMTKKNSDFTSDVAVASSGIYDIRQKNSDGNSKNRANENLSFTHIDITDYSAYTPPSLAVKSATFDADYSNISVIKDILYEFRNSIEVSETSSNISITIDSVNYDVLVSRLKMSEVCKFKQMQGRDYSMSYTNLVRKQKSLLDDPTKYDELEVVTSEIEELVLKLGSNTIKINFD